MINSAFHSEVTFLLSQAPASERQLSLLLTVNGKRVEHKNRKKIPQINLIYHFKKSFDTGIYGALLAVLFCLPIVHLTPVSVILFIE